MKKVSFLLVSVVLILTFAVSVSAQGEHSNEQGDGSLGVPVNATPELPNQVESRTAAVPVGAVPRLLQFSGSVTDNLGRARTGAVGITFAVYAEQEGGAPLWLETQNVQLNAQGHYTVLLGAEQTEGFPLDVLTGGEARWLGIQVQGQAEQPRILLVSVPYALKAEEAERLGGKTASDFVLTEQLDKEVREKAEIIVQQEVQTQTTEEGIPISNISEGPSLFTGSTTDQIVRVRQTGSGVGILATAETNAAVQGLTSTGIGLRGRSNNTSGFGVGVLGDAESVSGTGVRGQVLGTATGDPVGVKGLINNTTGAAGHFQNINTGGALLRGTVGSGAGTQVFNVRHETTPVRLSLTSTGFNTASTLASVGFADRGFTDLMRITYNGQGSTTANRIDFEVDGIISASTSDEVVMSLTALGDLGIRSLAFTTFTGLPISLRVGQTQAESIIAFGTAEFIQDCGAFLVCVGEPGTPGTGDTTSLRVTENLTVDGNSTVSGTKAAIVAMADNSRANVYSIESPEIWFEDFGSAQLKNGVFTVAIDAGFLQTVNTRFTYHVFLTPLGPSQGLYVEQKGPNSFVVRSNDGSDVAFDYRIVAKRKGYEALRLAPFNPQARIEQAKSQKKITLQSQPRDPRQP